MLGSLIWESGTLCFVLFFSELCFVPKNNLRLFAQICSDYQLMYLCIAIQSQEDVRLRCIWTSFEERLHLSKAKSELSLCIRFARSLTYWHNLHFDKILFFFHFLSFCEMKVGFLGSSLRLGLVMCLWIMGGQRTARSCPAATARQFSLTPTHIHVCMRTLSTI